MSFPVQDLILLGLLAREPMHGYDLKQIIEQRMAEIASVSPGTIYYTLKKLERRGLVLATSDRKGNRPERRVYTITPTGRQLFAELLRQSIRAEERPYYLFDVGLYFTDHLEPGELEDAVDAKLRGVAAFHAHVEQLGKDNPGRWPFHLDALRRKGMLLSGALGEWYRYLQSELRKRAAKTPTSDHGAARRRKTS